jgi:hypothetical protein
MKAYCPNCDRVHPLVESYGGKHICREKDDILFVLECEVYVGVHHCYIKGKCSCKYACIVKLGTPDICETCGMCRVAILHEHIMLNFMKQLWREARGEFSVSHIALRNTFPEQYEKMVDKSDKGNRRALAPHLPIVLINIVKDYLAYPHG